MIFGRPSELTYYCPCIKDVSIPELQVSVANNTITAVNTVANGNYDIDGIPKFIIFKLRIWKGHYSENDARAYKICRNYLNAQYCPVIAMLRYLQLRGSGDGPIFAEIDANDQSLVGVRRVSTYSSGHGMHNTWLDANNKACNVINNFRCRRRMKIVYSVQIPCDFHEVSFHEMVECFQGFKIGT